MKHTNSPWSIDHEVSEDGPVIAGPDGYVFAQLYANEGEGCPLANARLIAAAPEMLEALKRAEFYFDQNGGHEAYTWLHEIKSAIAKAQGAGESTAAALMDR